MNGKDSSDDTKPCWEGVALGWRKDIPDSLRLRPRAGESFHLRCRGDHSLVLQSEEEPASLSIGRSDSVLNVGGLGLHCGAGVFGLGGGFWEVF